MFELRPFQKQALQILASSHSSHLLCIAPTGTGKSLIYEIWAARQGARTLLVSPLVALARQQAQRLRASGLRVAESHEKPKPETGIWIMSPETLNRFDFKATLESWRPTFLVVDECHCVWEWGDDFRPAFLRIPELIREHSITRSLWLTATLPDHAKESLKKLLPNSLIEMGHFEMPEQLFLEVRKVSWVDRTQALVQWIHTHARGEPGIVFAATREGSTRIGRLIEALGLRTMVYHAGLGSEERRAIEKQVREKKVDVIIATSAFGMGMDYPHLKWVVMWQAPLSLLALAQAIGRVGRAMNSGTAMAFWDPEDFRLLEWAALRSDRHRQELIYTHNFYNSYGCRKFLLRRYFDQSAPPVDCGSTCDWCVKWPENKPLQLVADSELVVE